MGPVKIRFAPFQDPSQLEGQHSVSAISGAVIDNDVEGIFFFKQECYRPIEEKGNLAL